MRWPHCRGYFEKWAPVLYFCLVCVNICLPASFFKVRSQRSKYQRSCVCVQYPVTLLLCCTVLYFILLCWFKLTCRMVCVIHTSATSQHTVCLPVCVSFTSVCSTETLCLARFLFLSLALSLLCLIPRQPISIQIKVIVAKRSKYYRLHGLSQWMFFTQNTPKGSDHSNYKQFKTYFLTYLSWYMFTRREFLFPKVSDIRLLNICCYLRWIEQNLI